MNKASSLLAELESLAPGQAPSAFLHVACYAMFHSAHAMPFAHQGAAAKRHASVARPFALLMKDRPDGRKLGSDLKKAIDERLASDYGLDTFETACVERDPSSRPALA